MAPAPKLKPVEQQVVALMGASSGLGRETALPFAEKGARAVVSARSEVGLESLVEEIRQAGGEATAIPADVTDFEQVEAGRTRARAVADGQERVPRRGTQRREGS
jgi:NADP-dependent 3-hydroxy acid dehydrogenase YdfG